MRLESDVPMVGYIWSALKDALSHFNDDDGWAMASHVALSSLLALFPFVIFGTALASFLGADQFAEAAEHLIFDTWPEQIATPIAGEVVRVMTVGQGRLATFSALAAAFFASNGVEALRVSLNRAYRVEETRPWYVTRLLSLGYVVIAVFCFMAISFLLVLAPLAGALAREYLPWSANIIDLLDNWRVWVAVLMLIVGLLIAHKWLPANRRRLQDILPGIGLTLIFWIAGASLFAAYLSRFATYTTTYAGLASIMIALIFLYIIAVIFIVGAELNAALMVSKRDSNPVSQ